MMGKAVYFGSGFIFLKFKDLWFCVTAFVELALVPLMIGLMEHGLHLLVTKKKSELE